MEIKEIPLSFSGGFVNLSVISFKEMSFSDVIELKTIDGTWFRSLLISHKHWFLKRLSVSLLGSKAFSAYAKSAGMESRRWKHPGTPRNTQHINLCSEIRDNQLCSQGSTAANGITGPDVSDLPQPGICAVCSGYLGFLTQREQTH